MPYGSSRHILPTNCHLLGAEQEPYKKAHYLMKNSFKTWGGKSWEDSPDYKKNAERERARRLEFKKSNREDKKRESNDSPKIQEMRNADIG